MYKTVLVELNLGQLTYENVVSLIDVLLSIEDYNTAIQRHDIIKQLLDSKLWLEVSDLKRK
jgi:hypothetical protein